MPDERPPRPAPEHLALYAEQFNASTTLRSFGVRVSFPDADTVRCVIDPIRPEQRGGLGTDAVNGGVLAAMFDLAIGCTGALVDPTRASPTMQLTMSFMRPVTGTRMTIEASIDHVGSKSIFATARILDEGGRVCAKGQGVVRRSEKTWARKTSPAVN